MIERPARQLGQLVRRARRRSGMSQATLGRDVCVSQSYIYWIESGKHVPRAHIRRRLIASLDLSPRDANRLQKLAAAARPLRRDSDEYRAMLRRRGFQPSSTIGPRYRKGNVPWNKNLKGIHLSPQTEFERGTRHGIAARNHKPVGTVTIRRDKTGRRRYWIKVRPSRMGMACYIPLARYRYEHAHGPLPAGTFVVHADGNTMNDQLDNLILMDRQHQLAWQRCIRPNMEAKRKRRQSRAARQRWADYRQLNAACHAKESA